MTGSQIITKFINMVDDELDSDYMYQLMNDAKNEIESERVWEILKDKQSITASETALASDFNFDLLLTDGTTKYSKIKKEESDILDGGAMLYYLDMLNNNLEIINYDSSTLYFYYTIITSDITSTTEWSFPARFHSVLAYKMAQIYYSADAGEKGRAWDDRWKMYYTELMNKLYVWDDRLKLSKSRVKNELAPTQLSY